MKGNGVKIAVSGVVLSLVLLGCSLNREARLKKLFPRYADDPVFLKAALKAEKVYKNEKGYPEAVFYNDTVMVFIPGGEFIMGQTEEEKQWLLKELGEEKYRLDFADEGPARKIYVSSFWISKYKVTNRQYVRFLMEAGVDHRNGCMNNQCIEIRQDDPESYIKGSKGHYYVVEGYENYPVTEISWYGAVQYCRWLASKTGLNFRLPTEAEWEKAARGTDGRWFPWGNKLPDCSLANYKDCGSYIKPVGAYPEAASPYGVEDMAGNLWDWIHDWYFLDYYKFQPKKDPTGPPPATNRSLRGGSWNRSLYNLRCANREHWVPYVLYNENSFRPAMDLGNLKFNDWY